MPEWIAESAFVPFMLGMLVTATFGGFAFILNSRSLAVVAAVAGLLSFGIVFAERFIVTDKEKVERLLYSVANAVEFNRHDEVLGYMKEGSQAFLAAGKELPRYVFRRCNVTGIIRLDLQEDMIPATATISFVVFVNVNAPSFGHDGFGRREITLWLERQKDGTWKIVDYDHRYPTGGAKL